MEINFKPNSITITYLSKVSFASLNGADKDVDNINPIKKITLNNGQELPYVSSQAIRRALRDKLEEMGWEISDIIAPKDKKGAPNTSMNPEKYIDDDLFGYMRAESGDDGAKGKSTIRTSPVRVEALLALEKYQGNLDFGTNYMGKDKGIDPNIYETEIHSGFYRGSILIELDRIGCKEGFEQDLKNEDKIKRVKGFIDALQNLWSSGRQSRFLADISPKFIAAAYMKSKNPVFMEAVNVNKDNKVDLEILDTVNKDYKNFIIESVLAEQKAVINSGEKALNLKDGFDKIKSWIDSHYKGQ
jgi:CRISPR-associated protein Cst2